MNNPNEPQEVRINLAQAADVICDNCGDPRFEPVYLMKRLSSLMSPTGKAELIPLGPPIVPPIFACLACGHINEEFLPAAIRAQHAVKEETASSPILKLEE